MTTFVLVHGGWTGAHGWRTVRRLLAGAGHEVFTPSLTGIGERVHLVSPQVDLTTHVQDVVNQVLFEDLADIVLVGHSYGGFVAAGAVLHVHERIRELVFLDAFVPADGDSVFALAGRPGPPVLRWAPVGSSRRFRASTTTPPRAPGRAPDACPTRRAASSSRFGWRSPSRSTTSV